MKYVLIGILVFIIAIWYLSQKAKQELKSESDKSRPVQSTPNPPSHSSSQRKKTQSNFEDIYNSNIPYEWYQQNRSFLESMRKKYGNLLDRWANSRNINTSPKIQLKNLSEFVSFMDEELLICKQKGEYYEAWFYQYLTTPDYIEKRRSELQNLAENIEDLQAKFEKRKNELVDLDARIIQALKQNDGILQSEFAKLFDVSVKNDVCEKLYFMEKNGDLQRIKSGKSYILHYLK